MATDDDAHSPRGDETRPGHPDSAAQPASSPDPSEQAAWEELVERLRTSDPLAQERGSWPRAEDVDTEAEEVPEAGTAVDHADEPYVAYEADDHYVPPLPPPAPRLSKVGRWGVGFIALGTFLLIAPGVVGLHRTTGTFAIAVACVVGGSVALLSRVRPGPSQDDGWDDGAVL